jgi:hypothetical protein
MIRPRWRSVGCRCGLGAVAFGQGSAAAGDLHVVGVEEPAHLADVRDELGQFVAFGACRLGAEQRLQRTEHLGRSVDNGRGHAREHSERMFGHQPLTCKKLAR